MADFSKAPAKGDVDKLREHLDALPPELKIVDDNLDFEEKVEEKPIPPGVGTVDVFGETWDINAILKGNYWRRSIYTTDKICKLFLKASIETQKKYFKKKNAMEFQYWWLIVLVFIGIGALAFMLIFVLPRVGGII